MRYIVAFMWLQLNNSVGLLLLFLGCVQGTQSDVKMALDSEALTNAGIILIYICAERLKVICKSSPSSNQTLA